MSQSLTQLVLQFFSRELVLPVPTITKGKAGLTELTRLRTLIPEGPVRLIFDFSECGALPVHGIAYLGGIAQIALARGGRVAVLSGSLRNITLRDRLWQNGFLAAIGHQKAQRGDANLSFRHYGDLNPSGVFHYLENYWLASGAVRLSEDLKSAILGSVWEIYANAFEHSESEIGVVNCGEFDRNQRRLQLAVMDLGVGIPGKVQRSRRAATDPGKAMRWAFTRGTSTTEVGYSRGLGLDTVKEFIRVNKGRLEVYSNNGYAKIDAAGEEYRRSDVNVHGTLVTISLQADEKLYCFDYEASKFSGKA